MRILLIVYDNGSYIPFPPLGPMYLTAVLEQAGHQVDIFHQDVTHAPSSALTRYTNVSNHDVVGLGFQAGYYQYAKAKEIAEAVNASIRRDKFKFILGGHGPAAAPDFFREKLGADCVFVGEALLSILEYMRGGMKERTIKSGTLVDPNHFPRPAYDRFPMQIYRLLRLPTSKRTDFCFPVLSGSGCKWSCTFCYRMDKGFRPRSASITLDEILDLWTKHDINHFQFADELFMSSRSRVQEFCAELIRARGYGYLPDSFKFDVNGRLNFAQPDILQIMKKAGCEYVNYGIESMDPQVLKNINKGLTPEQITEGVENTLKAGMVPGLNFMWGNIGDTAKSLDLAADFIIKYNTGHELRTIRPVTPYPGSPLFKEALNRGLVDSVEDFYENKHVNSDLFSCNFMDIPTDEAHRLLYKANLRIMRHHYEARRMQVNQEAFDFYEGFNKSFRGFRDV